MTYNTYLTSKQAVLSNLGGTCNNYRGCHIGMLSDFDIVRNMNEVIKFYTFTENRRTQGCPVNGRIGTYLDIIFDDYIADLRNFFMVVTKCKSKPIAA